MNFIKQLLFLFIFFGCFTIRAQINKEKEVLKILSFEKVEKLHQQTPKPIVIFLYTDWCKICFGMKKTTFSREEVITILNEEFYLIFLDGEEKRDISFLSKNFKFKPSGKNTGIHQLSAEFASIKRKISYPTITILNKNHEIVAQINSYLNSKNLQIILNKILKKD